MHSEFMSSSVYIEWLNLVNFQKYVSEYPIAVNFDDLNKCSLNI